MTRTLFFLCLILILSSVQAQDSLVLASIQRTSDTVAARTSPEQRVTERKVRTTAALMAAGYGGSLLLLDKAWYREFERTSFHTFNDSREWLQVDKAGHAWTAYQLSRGATALWANAGLAPRSSVLWGSVSGFSYLTVIELLDAHSARWGWSWADIGANAGGTLLFAAQEMAWGEQRVQFKFSASPRSYPGDLAQRADALYGSTLSEQLLKDYNVQTYWLSANLRSFLPATRLPAWLNLSVGYGADGLWGGFENRAYDEDGQLLFDRRDLPRRRQWYLAPDIDFTRIPSNKKWVRTFLWTLNAFKMPAPALELRSGKLRGHWLMF